MASLSSIDVVIIQGNMGDLPDRELYRIPIVVAAGDGSDTRFSPDSYLIWSKSYLFRELWSGREEVFSVYTRLGSKTSKILPEIRVTLSNDWLRRACKEGKPSEDSARKAAEELTCELAEKFGRLPCDEFLQK